MKADPRGCDHNLCNCVKKPEKKNSGLQRGLSRDLAILVRCSNQLNYEATDVGFQASLRNCISCGHNCKDQPSSDFISAVHI